MRKNGGGNRCSHDETERKLGEPPMAASKPTAPMAGNWYQRDRSEEAELAVVVARRTVAAALNYRPAKFTALMGEKR